VRVRLKQPGLDITGTPVAVAPSFSSTMMSITLRCVSTDAGLPSATSQWVLRIANEAMFTMRLLVKT